MMPSYESLRGVVFQLVTKNWPDETEDDLDQWVFSAYDNVAANPHESTRDLFHIYAMNLLNSSLRGPQMGPFGLMIAEAIHNKYLKDNAVQIVDVFGLADACAQVLEEGKITLVRAGNVNYLETLKQIAAGSESQLTSPVILKLLNSVVSFSVFLRRHYQGRADLYHQSFLNLTVESENGRYELLKAKTDEITHLPMMGPAIGPNFLKDSQILSLLGQTGEWKKFGLIPYFIKPDMHIGRMMLWMTRPHVRQIWTIEAFHILNAETIVFPRYTEIPPAKTTTYPALPKSSKSSAGKWRCMWDIWRWAESENQPPVYFDRLLYLAGSGKYRDGQEMRQTQLERYKAILRLAK